MSNGKYAPLIAPVPGTRGQAIPTANVAPQEDPRITAILSPPRRPPETMREEERANQALNEAKGTQRNADVAMFEAKIRELESEIVQRQRIIGKLQQNIAALKGSGEGKPVFSEGTRDLAGDWFNPSSGRITERFSAGTAQTASRVKK